MRQLHIGLLLVFMVILNACKKEAKIGDKNGIEKTQESGNKKQENPNNAIKKGEDGKYLFALKLAKEGIYKINSDISAEQIVTVNGNTNSALDSQSTKMDVSVKEMTESGYKLEVAIKAMKVKQKAQGKEILIDTNAPMPQTKQLQMPWRMQKAITNVPFIVEITNQGKVVKIIGLEAIYKKVETDFKKDFKPNEMQILLTSIKQNINEKMLKEQFEKGLNKFPNHSVAIGETWVEENNLPAEKLTQKYTYKLDKVENNEAYVSVVGSMNQNNEKSDPKLGIKQSISLSNNSKGNVIYDAATGWIKTSILTENIKGKQTIISSANKQTQSMEMSSNRVSKINL